MPQPRGARPNLLGTMDRDRGFERPSMPRPMPNMPRPIPNMPRPMPNMPGPMNKPRDRQSFLQKSRERTERPTSRDSLVSTPRRSPSVSRPYDYDGSAVMSLSSPPNLVAVESRNFFIHKELTADGVLRSAMPNVTSIISPPRNKTAEITPKSTPKIPNKDYNDLIQTADAILRDSLLVGNITQKEFAEIKKELESKAKGLTGVRRTIVPRRTIFVPGKGRVVVPAGGSSAALARRRTVVPGKGRVVVPAGGSSAVAAKRRTVVPGPCVDISPYCDKFLKSGVCPVVVQYMPGMCSKTCNDCSDNNVAVMKNMAELNSRQKVAERNLRAHFYASMNFMKSMGKTERSSIATAHNAINTTAPAMTIVYPALDPPDAVEYLDFETMKASNFIDKSNNYNDLRLPRAAISPKKLGTCGKAVILNDDHISWPGASLKRSRDTHLSVAMWVKLQKSARLDWLKELSVPEVALRRRTLSKVPVKERDVVLPAKRWLHIAGTLEPLTNHSQIYINGKKVSGRSTMTPNLAGVTLAFLDASLQYLDELYIYDQVLSPGDIEKLFEKCKFNSMVLHYGFSHKNLNQVPDQSGIGNDAMLTGGADTTFDCNRCGACLDLTHGEKSALQITRVSESELPSAQATISVWISLSSSIGTAIVFQTSSSNDQGGYQLEIVDGKVRWGVTADSGVRIFEQTTVKAVVPSSLWTHVLVTYSQSSGVVAIYANGVEQLSWLVPTLQRLALPKNWDKEASVGDASFSGHLDEFIMYNWSLELSEVAYVKNYCSEKPTGT